MPFPTLTKFSAQKTKEFLERYEKYLSPAALVIGFVFDNLTLKRADIWFDNLILITYLLLGGIGIFLFNGGAAGHFRNPKLQKLIAWYPLVLQFAFGGLFSGFVVLYSRSAALGASWPFLLILAVLLVGNEYFRHRYRRLVFQISIYFVAIFSYLIFAVPIVLDRIGSWVFLLSGIISLLVIGLIYRSIVAAAGSIIRPYRYSIVLWITLLFALFNVLYFTNVIPPIPLALQDLVIAHQVERQGNTLKIKFEPAPWYQFWRTASTTYHRIDNQPIFVFSAIYAPANLNTEIVHEWAVFDETRGHWKITDKIQYPIFGGRNEGFRGFSHKQTLITGRWRVTVATKNGQVLGRTSFTLTAADAPPNLVTENR